MLVLQINPEKCAVSVAIMLRIVQKVEEAFSSIRELLSDSVKNTHMFDR